MNAKKPIFGLRMGLALCLSTVLLSGCGGTKWGFPYKADVQQGNWITAQEVAQLQPGMTREQVRYVLGTPTLQDIFHADRWEYHYYIKPGYGDEELRLFTVWFEGDTLVRWEGSAQPTHQPFQEGSVAPDARTVEPTLRDTDANTGIEALPINQPQPNSGVHDSSHQPERSE